MLPMDIRPRDTRLAIRARARVNYHFFYIFVRSYAFGNIESSFIVVRPFRAEGRIRIRIKLPSRCSLVLLSLTPSLSSRSMNLIRADMRRTVICR